MGKAALLTAFCRGVMSVAENTQVIVSGLMTAESGNNWFLIDASGEFTVDRNIIATVWLVGGGCDGGAGVWLGNEVDSGGEPIANTSTGDSVSGSGGDGGYVYMISNIKIPRNTVLTSVIALANDAGGTSLTVKGIEYKCDAAGSVRRTGGAGGVIPQPGTDEKWVDQDVITPAGKGSNGGETPYGYVGSSGGGGAACNGQTNADNGVVGGEGAGSGTSHREAGTDAVNYGCGGGGGAVCAKIAAGQAGGKGKNGCIIISYTIDQSTLVVQKHYKKVVNEKKTCNTDYASSSNNRVCCSSNGCGCENVALNGYNYSDCIGISGSTAEKILNEIERLNKRSDEMQAEIYKLQAENNNGA